MTNHDQLEGLSAWIPSGRPVTLEKLREQARERADGTPPTDEEINAAQGRLIRRIERVHDAKIVWAWDCEDASRRVRALRRRVQLRELRESLVSRLLDAAEHRQ